MFNILIGVATFNRPNSLIKTIKSLELLSLTESTAFTVLVVDNCAKDFSGIRAVESTFGNQRITILTRMMPDRGISHVRNAMLEEFFANKKFTHLAMVDDDQEVHREWLQCLLNCSLEFNADVVGSYVESRFLTTPPTWVKQLDIFNRKKRISGAVDIVHGTGGVLFSRSFFDTHGFCYFDNDFALTGGEDTEFFYKLSLQGANFAFSSESICYEYYDSSRLTIEWAMKRAERIGNAEARILMKHERGLVKLCLSAFMKSVSLLPLILLFRYQPEKKIKYQLSLMHKIGIFRGVYGSSKNVY